ncbi:MAG: Dermonecrotic toxin [Pelotomaculum sp. PtaB.Bin013]|uniref:Dermonecrotic toxin C3 domain-containing protein n=1 Tax=Pelotomaculum isophthalicicum JI TaxID=947010 RepID=A0A9X4H6D7_9FIRM|nr:CFI-box-CTERM domain-containing protein [Pelotomaculum isophthalicicum]MDF9408798.1 hypothetical protein [Pelotomaculum isophthalicicum JI]OPX91295.1 MAG: Dermonecrotic toxin [Pelotomaculum sp. PtaB.Bin013]
MFTQGPKTTQNSHKISEKHDKTKTIEPKSTQSGLPPGFLQTQENILQLQKTIGNRAVIQLLNSHFQQQPVNDDPLYTPVVQRMRNKPSDEEIRNAVSNYVSSEKGTCDTKAPLVQQALEAFVDSKSEITGYSLAWWQLEENRWEAQNHTAAAVKWNEGTYIVDTTISQFGQVDNNIQILPLNDWIGLIMRLTHGERPYCEEGIRKGNSLFFFEPQEERPVISEEKENKKEELPEKGKGGGCCFLTSACVRARGLSDDCAELTTLRAFRDGWLSSLPEGPELIATYYKIAPIIVDAVEASGAAKEIWNYVYQVIIECIRDIDNRRPEQALVRYRDMVFRIKHTLAVLTLTRI